MEQEKNRKIVDRNSPDRMGSHASRERSGTPVDWKLARASFFSNARFARIPVSEVVQRD